MPTDEHVPVPRTSSRLRRSPFTEGPGPSRRRHARRRPSVCLARPAPRSPPLAWARPGRVGDLVVGASTAVGEQGGDVARAAALWADWPDGTSAGVVSRLCCSGLEAIEVGAAKVAAAIADVTVVGGVESMSRVPMLADKPAFTVEKDVADRTGYVSLGVAADLLAAELGLTRAELDSAAVRSHHRAYAAPASGSIVPVRSGGAVVLSADEGPRADVTLESLAELPSLFGEEPSWQRVLRRLPGSVRPVAGLHTAATAPQMCDGAALLVLGTQTAASTVGREPIAEVLSVAQVAVRSPRLDAPLVAARRALAAAGLKASDCDVVEANESFAASTLLIERELGLDESRVNPVGGSMATGHPLGAGGAVLAVNALDQLRRTGGTHALITIPAALGLGAAVVLRRLS